MKAGLLAVALLVSACARTEENAGAMTPEPRSDVRRISQDARGEVWRGRTVVYRGSIQITVDEDVSFDPQGALIHGFTRIDEGGRSTERWIEPRSGTVTVKGTQTHTFRPPMDRPWVYGPVETSSGDYIATPLSAWMTARAKTEVRVITRDSSTLSSPRDLLSTMGAEVDQHFVVRTSRMTRQPFPVDGTFAFK